MKKVWIASILALMFTIAMFSGCIFPDEFPVKTIKAFVNPDREVVGLRGGIGAVWCKARHHTLVWDDESHENWEDYEFMEEDENHPPDSRRFAVRLEFSEIQKGVTYYFRAVAYCYDFKRPFKDYEERYYQGEELTFIVD